MTRHIVWVAALMLAALPASADGPRGPAPTDPVWQEECGSCHIAYPPRFLPAASWQRQMRGLGEHFGSDATLDPQLATRIEAFLVANARSARESDGATPPLRITELKWFRSEHRRIPEATWKSQAVGSPANCAACHLKADTGRFGENDIRVPR